MTNDKIAEIKERHLFDEHWRSSPLMHFETCWPQTHDHRATLLAEVERLTRERDEARAALRASSCAYPDCVDLGSNGKCTKWLLGECNPTLEAKP